MSALEALFGAAEQGILQRVSDLALTLLELTTANAECGEPRGRL